MPDRRKVTVVGGGNVGATCAQVLATRDYADVVLVDIVENLPQGKALDINQMGAVLGYEPSVTGSNDYGPTAGSDVVVITAGLPRSPGMSRDDLVTTNEKIVKDVTAVVLGGHGDQMVSVISATTVGGVPIRKLVSEDKIAAMVERTAKGGGELVQLMGTSAWYAPGAASAQMVDSILLDEKRVLPCTAFLEGEYGIDGLYMGVPVKLGSTGIEQIYEVDLDAAEQAALKASADAVRDVVSVLSS